MGWVGWGRGGRLKAAARSSRSAADWRAWGGGLSAAAAKRASSRRLPPAPRRAWMGRARPSRGAAPEPRAPRTQLRFEARGPAHSGAGGGGGRSSGGRGRGGENHPALGGEVEGGADDAAVARRVVSPALLRPALRVPKPPLPARPPPPSTPADTSRPRHLRRDGPGPAKKRSRAGACIGAETGRHMRGQGVGRSDAHSMRSRARRARDPRSPSLTREAPLRKTLAGLRSRCTMCFPCRYPTACETRRRAVSRRVRFAFATHGGRALEMWLEMWLKGAGVALQARSGGDCTSTKDRSG